MGEVSNEFWWGLWAGGVLASVVSLATAVVHGLWYRRRAYNRTREVSPKAWPPPIVMEIRDNRQDRNLMRAWHADRHELNEAEMNKLRGRR